MKVAIVSQYFPPDKPGRIVDELSQELARRGHTVRVLTAFPHYDGGSPGGYRQRLRHFEERGSVKVRRVPIIASHSRNAVGRIASYLSFAWSARLASSFIKGADVVYVHGTPATASHPAYVWWKRYGVPYVFHVQDIWPESVTASGFLPPSISKLADWALSRWLHKVYRAAAAVVAIAPSAQHLFVERGAAPDRVQLVYNWARDVARESESIEPRASGLRLLYAGNLGVLQDLETVFRAAAEVRDLEGLQLEVAGSGVLEKRLKDLADELGLGDTVRFLGRVSPENIGDFYAECDFQIVPLRRLDIFASTIPSKFQAGLAHHVPVITTVAGDVSLLVKEHELGLAAEPQDVQALAAAFRRAHAMNDVDRQRYRRNARDFYHAHLTKERGVSAIEDILLTASNNRHGRLLRARKLGRKARAIREEEHDVL